MRCRAAHAARSAHDECRREPHSQRQIPRHTLTSELVRVGKLSEHICIPVHTLRRLADAGKIPSVRTKGGHLVWQQINNVLHLDEGPPAGGSLRYAITGMFNTPIDTATGRAPPSRSGRHQTTWKERHTGEGIFFTSKVMDVFQLSSNGIRWTVDNTRGDHAVGVSDVEVGTVVVGQVDAQTTRSTREVFGAYSQDYEFVRTRPAVKLFGLGLRFVSRSEARRLLANWTSSPRSTSTSPASRTSARASSMSCLRVWPHEHSGKSINPINMNEAVEFMIKRGLRR